MSHSSGRTGGNELSRLAGPAVRKIPKPQIQALAVLPLANLSGDPEQEYFADGMTGSPDHRTGPGSTSPTSDFPAIRNAVQRQREWLKKEIAGELKVDAVLEGTVARSGDRVRVTMHLRASCPRRSALGPGIQPQPSRCLNPSG